MSLYTGGRETVLMCIPAAWPVTDIGGLLWCVVFVPGSWGLGPGTHHTQETGPGPELHIKHTGNTHRKQSLTAHSSILHSSPTDLSAGLAAKALLTTCLIPLQCVQFPLTAHTQTYREPWSRICFSEDRAEFTLLFVKCYMNAV